MPFRYCLLTCLCLIGYPYSCMAQCFQWSLRSAPGTAWHTMAYDDYNKRLIIAGGTILPGGCAPGPNGCAVGTLSAGLDGWVLETSDGPPQGQRQSSAYDSKRRRVVLFGRGSSANLSAETWEWDGIRWELRSTTGPSPRSRPGLAYDRSRQSVLLFGGTDASGPRSDLWGWDGAAWSLLEPDLASPGGDFSTALATAPEGGVYAWGGTQFEDVVWHWNGSWGIKALHSPAPPNAAMAFDDSRGAFVLFEIFSGDTWEYRNNTWTHFDTNRSDLWTGHPVRLCYAPVFNGVVMRGPSGELLTWNGTQWAEALAYGPPARSFAAGWHNVDTGMTYVHGGFKEEGALQSDCWAWNGQAWQFVGDVGPSSRMYHAAAFDSHRHCAVLFGGGTGRHWQGGSLFGDTWEFRDNGWNLVASDGPSARGGHCMTFDTARGVVVLFGGDTSAAGGSVIASGETWEWNGSIWSLVSQTGPSARFGACMTFDSTRGRCVLAGGQSSGGAMLQDLWEWDGKEWAEQATNVSVGRDALMAFDPVRGRSVIFGGTFSEEFGDNRTFEWNGSTFMERFVPHSPRRFASVMVYENARHGMLFFGGNPQTTSDFRTTQNDTWRFALPGDANGDGSVNSADLSVLLSQFGSLVAPWVGADSNGDGTVDGADLSVLLANFEC